MPDFPPQFRAADATTDRQATTRQQQTNSPSIAACCSAIVNLSTYGATQGQDRQKIVDVSRRKEEGRRKKEEYSLFLFCLLPSAFCLSFSSSVWKKT